MSPGKPKNMTEARRKILQAFLTHDDSRSGKYGKLSSDTWIQQLICRLKRHNNNTGNVTVYDVKAWLQTSEFTELLKADEAVLSASTGISAAAPVSPADQEVSSSSFSPPQKISSVNVFGAAEMDFQNTTDTVQFPFNKISESNQKDIPRTIHGSTTASLLQPEVSSSFYTSPRSDMNMEDMGTEEMMQADNIKVEQKPFASSQSSSIPAEASTDDDGFTSDQTSVRFPEFGSAPHNTPINGSSDEANGFNKEQQQIDSPSEITVHIKPIGFTIHVPPRSTTTTVYIEPNGWIACKHHSHSTDFSTLIPPDAEKISVNTTTEEVLDKYSA